VRIKRKFGHSYSYLAPFVLWNSLATKTAEMMLASAHVIGHRVPRMARAGAAPSARDQREFALMGWEKLDAGARSLQAMGSCLLNGNRLAWNEAAHNMLRSTSAFMMLLNSQTPAQLLTRQLALAHALGNSMTGFAKVTNNATRLAHRGLKPIHAKATANAKRLGRRR
jgi:hypothetical protein